MYSYFPLFSTNFFALDPPPPPSAYNTDAVDILVFTPTPDVPPAGPPVPPTPPAPPPPPFDSNGPPPPAPALFP